MKKKLILLGLFLFSQISIAQVGINTPNPQQVFHIDGGKDNPESGVPNTTQQLNDVVVTDEGKVGIGTTTPTQSLDVNGRTRIRNTDELTSTNVSALYVDETGLVGKANIAPQSKVAYYSSTSSIDFIPSDFNEEVIQIVPIDSSHEKINSIGAVVPSLGQIQITESGNYMINSSINLLLKSASGTTGNEKVYIAIQVDKSTDNGANWTTITGMRPISQLHWGPGTYITYNVPTIINYLEAGDLIRLKFYRTRSGSTPQGVDLELLKAGHAFGAPTFTLSLSKL